MNRNSLYSQTLVDELVRAGLRRVCISPGSRNTPLVMAFAQHGGVQVSSHLDERSAAFFALGAAIGSGEPVALLCTSGSAAANYFPAIVEAHQSRIPLIVITADRPHELRHSGANQTIDQIKMYGDYALWSVDMALPEAAPTAQALRNVRTTANRAVAVANGLNGRKGVVHLNVPFRSPLEPVPIAGDVTQPPAAAAAREGVFTRIIAPQPPTPEPAALDPIAQLIAAQPAGAIVCGPLLPTSANAELAAQVAALSQRTGYPIFADPLGLRFGLPNALGLYESYLHPQSALLPHLPKPQIIIRIGSVPTGKWLTQYLAEAEPKDIVHFSGDGVWSDDSHRVSHFIHANEACGIAALLQAPALSQPQPRPVWGGALIEAEQRTKTQWQTTLDKGAWFDGVVAHDMIDLLPAQATLMAGNSLPIRHVEQFGAPSAKPLYVHANRGASGIDGNLSTALGMGYARPAHPLAALVGDITLYHDLNGLLAVRRCGVPITLVLLNNNGGGIFHRLAVKDFEPEFTEHFLTPHGLDYAPAAQMFGLDYVLAENRQHFRETFASSVNHRRSSLIEVRTDARADFAARTAFLKGLK